MVIPLLKMTNPPNIEGVMEKIKKSALHADYEGKPKYELCADIRLLLSTLEHLYAENGRYRKCLEHKTIFEGMNFIAEARRYASLEEWIAQCPNEEAFAEAMAIAAGNIIDYEKEQAIASVDQSPYTDD